MGLKKKLEAFVDIFEEVLDADRFCLCGMLAAEIPNLDSASRALLADFFLGAEEWISATLEADAERIDAGLKPKQLAKILMSGLEGAVLLARVEGGKVRLNAQRDLVRTLVT